jgi:hypothetical protein
MISQATPTGGNNGSYDKNPMRHISSAAAESFMPEGAARIREMAPNPK